MQEKLHMRGEGDQEIFERQLVGDPDSAVLRCTWNHYRDYDASGFRCDCLLRNTCINSGLKHGLHIQEENRMRSGKTIVVKNLCDKDVEINEVVIYPQTNKQGTLFWKVEGLFGSYRFTLCLTTNRQEAMECFETVNKKLLEVHEGDLMSRYDL